MSVCVCVCGCARCVWVWVCVGVGVQGVCGCGWLEGVATDSLAWLLGSKQPLNYMDLC